MLIWALMTLIWPMFISTLSLKPSIFTVINSVADIFYIVQFFRVTVWQNVQLNMDEKCAFILFQNAEHAHWFAAHFDRFGRQTFCRCSQYFDYNAELVHSSLGFLIVIVLALTIPKIVKGLVLSYLLFLFLDLNLDLRIARCPFPLAKTLSYITNWDLGWSCRIHSHISLLCIDALVVFFARMSMPVEYYIVLNRCIVNCLKGRDVNWLHLVIQV